MRQPDLHRPPTHAGIAAARGRSDLADAHVAGLAERLGGWSSAVAVVALGAYGRRELTPRTDVELLFLHGGELTVRHVTETICYPLWERDIRAEPSVRTLADLQLGGITDKKFGQLRITRISHN